MEQSYNGWDASTDKSAIGIIDLKVTIDGVTYSFPGGCKGGDVHTIFSHFLPRYHAKVESLGRGDNDEWGYSYRKNRNADNLSCHSSGTAIDVNASEHPNGSAHTLNDPQVSALRDVLAFYEGVLKWGGDFHGTKDEMHYEIHGDAADAKRIADKIRNATAKPLPPAKPLPAHPSWWTHTIQVHDHDQSVASALKVLDNPQYPPQVTLDDRIARLFAYIKSVHKDPDHSGALTLNLANIIQNNYAKK